MSPESSADRREIDRGDREAMEAALSSTAFRLHGIASRTSAAQIAAEVLRLNDAVLAAADGRIRSSDQPADFMSVLLAEADSTNGGGAE